MDRRRKRKIQSKQHLHEHNRKIQQPGKVMPKRENPKPRQKEGGQQ